MARAIYAIKIFLFREQFKLEESTLPATAGDISSEICLKDIVTFIVTSYVRYWFTTPSPSAAPRNDWLWLQSLRNYKVGAIRSIS
jgi:hypothetical protein